jgi:hypothetical protein
LIALLISPVLSSLADILKLCCGACISCCLSNGSDGVPIIPLKYLLHLISWSEGAVSLDPLELFTVASSQMRFSLDSCLVILHRSRELLDLAATCAIWARLSTQLHLSCLAAL